MGGLGVATGQFFVGVLEGMIPRVRFVVFVLNPFDRHLLVWHSTPAVSLYLIWILLVAVSCLALYGAPFTRI